MYVLLGHDCSIRVYLWFMVISHECVYIVGQHFLIC